MWPILGPVSTETLKLALLLAVVNDLLQFYTSTCQLGSPMTVLQPPFLASIVASALALLKEGGRFFLLTPTPPKQKTNKTPAQSFLIYFI